jgi:hypothetical protein
MTRAKRIVQVLPQTKPISQLSAIIERFQAFSSPLKDKDRYRYRYQRTNQSEDYQVKKPKSPKGVASEASTKRETLELQKGGSNLL